MQRRKRILRHVKIEGNAAIICRYIDGYKAVARNTSVRTSVLKSASAVRPQARRPSGRPVGGGREAHRRGIKTGGERGIRTLGTLARSTVFETAPIDHSGTSPTLREAAL